jgi:outer membrane protein OmpA-like peptidoglycan-associated protein
VLLPDSSQTVWKPLFWLTLAALIGVYLLYNYHSDQLQHAIGSEQRAIRALEQRLASANTELDSAKQAVSAARTRIAALEQTHAEDVADLEAAHAQALEQLQSGYAETTASLEVRRKQQLAALNAQIDALQSQKTLLRAEAEAWQRAKETLETDLRAAIEATDSLREHLAETAEERRELEVKLAADDATIADLNALLNRANQTEAALQDKLARGLEAQDELAMLVAKEEAAILELQDKLVATTQAREQLEQALASVTNAPPAPAAEGTDAEALKATLRAERDQRLAAAEQAAKTPQPAQQAELEAKIEAAREQLRSELAAEREALKTELAAAEQRIQQVQQTLTAERDALEQALQTRSDAQRDEAADYEARIAQAEQALEAMRTEMETTQQALEDAQARAKRRQANLANEAANAVHAFYDRFAAFDARVTERGLLINLASEGLRFPTGGALIPTQAEALLDRLADALSLYPDRPILIEGHTDSSGSTELNERLSQQRAQAVRAALIERGIAAERLRAQGIGATQPIASNATASGRQRNRRVELYIELEQPAPEQNG